MDCLGLFAKYWEPGKVKTRLARQLGDDRASEIYRFFLQTLVKRFERTADSRVLCFTPSDQMNPFANLAGSAWTLLPQAAGDLGQRMSAFFETCFQAGAQRVVLIGSDSPSLPAEHIATAFRRLGDTDVVLGPTEDGGYYLVGASRDVAGIFQGIDWSTPRVWEQTVARIGRLQLSYQSLPRWYDVDELPDLLRLRDELLQMPQVDLQLRELLAVVRHAL